MRGAVAILCVLACAVANTPASAAGCPGNPNALGTSRTIVIDPSEHTRLGGYQYAESLPLRDREVVLTFDDGPLPPHTTRVLDVLARECVKATFFMVGRMAREYPRLVRRVYEDGHNVASHSLTHPYSFYRMSILDAAWEIDESFEALSTALGDASKVAPFFRFPGLHRQNTIEQHLASKGKMVWSVDFMGDDWMPIGSSEIVRRALSRLEAQGKGILMLHDIKPTTAAGLQELLDELKRRRFRIVHVLPATADRPKTETTPEQWRVARPPTPQELSSREPSVWPRAFARKVSRPEPHLDAPNPVSFGAEATNAKVPVALVPPDDVLRSDRRPIVLPPQWPDEVTTSALPKTELLPVPAADTFRYTSTQRVRTKRSKERPRAMHAASPGLNDAASAGRRSLGGSPKAGSNRKGGGDRTLTGTSGREPKSTAPGKAGPRQSGHQIQLPGAAPRVVQRN